MFEPLNLGKVNLDFNPHYFQIDAARRMVGKKYFTMVCHRRFGKTVFAISWLNDKAMSFRRSRKHLNVEGRFDYIAPYRNQAKDIAWMYLLQYATRIPGVKINNSDLEILYPNGARIKLWGTDNPNTQRGGYIDAVVLDEFGDMPPAVWEEVISFKLADHDGEAMIIGTPKGYNQFYDFYLRGFDDSFPEWGSAMYKASETVPTGHLHWLTVPKIEALKRASIPSKYRQEMECDFNASSDNTLISIDTVDKARTRFVAEEDLTGQPLIFGIDVARHGDDSSVIAPRKGPVMLPPTVFQGLDNMQFAAEIMRRVVSDSPDAVFVDAGQGSGVIDRLRQLGANVIEVHFGGAAIQDGPNGYVNKRAEMWDTMRKWLDESGSIPDEEKLTRELTAVEYELDAKCRVKLESKKEVKARLKRSTDIADALALTFAQPVMVTDPYESRYGGGRNFAIDTLAW